MTVILSACITGANAPAIRAQTRFDAEACQMPPLAVSPAPVSISALAPFAFASLNLLPLS